MPEPANLDVVARLEAENAALLALVAKLQARIEDLEARLRMNSTTSSKPPSSDGYGKPPRAERRRHERAARKPGKQPGAPGSHLPMVEHPTTTIVSRPEQCPCCQSPVGDDTEVVHTERRQVIEVDIQLAVTEHQVVTVRCGCGQQSTGVYPQGVNAPVQYGPGVRAFATYLVAVQHLPLDRAVAVLHEVLGLSTSKGTVAAMVAEAGAAAVPVVEVIGEQIAAADVAHFDETGSRVDGSLHWIHSASTSSLTHLTVHPRRGKVAMDAAGILPKFKGVGVHDGWKPYWLYGILHGLCNAHHIRELAFVADELGQRWGQDMIDLLLDAKKAADQARELRMANVAPDTVTTLLRRYDQVIESGTFATTLMPRKKAVNLLRRLTKQKDEALRFLTDLRIPFDNNQAERDIRMAKLQQKISGCWRTIEGAEAFLALRSCISTARKQGHRVLDVIRTLFSGPLWIPTPAVSGSSP